MATEELQETREEERIRQENLRLKEAFERVQARKKERKAKKHKATQNKETKEVALIQEAIEMAKDLMDDDWERMTAISMASMKLSTPQGDFEKFVPAKEGGKTDDGEKADRELQKAWGVDPSERFLGKRTTTGAWEKVYL